MRLIYAFIFTFSFFHLSLSQSSPQLRRTADSLYQHQSYAQGAAAYLNAAEREEYNLNKKNDFYNAACCYALLGDHAQAFDLLKRTLALGYRDGDHLVHDTDLNSLHNDPQWADILRPLEEYERTLRNPEEAKLVTSDIHNFWTAYDDAQRDAGRAQEIFKREYFDKASEGLQDYIALRIGSIENFVANQKKKPKFYAAIRENTRMIDDFKDPIRKSFVRLHELYDDAVFPNVYFVIGRWSSAGTVSDNGMLIGADMLTKSYDIPLDELNLWERNNYKSIADLPYLVAHELIHIQQGRVPEDTTLISAAVREGMADFIGELISGRTANERLKEFAKGKERQLWDDFKKEMFLNRAKNWIANAGQETPDHPADLGYYIGYRICQSYYNGMADKKQAIRDMLSIKDFRKFLEKSRYEQQVER